MALTAMTGIHRSSKRSLVEYINDANGTNLDVDEVYFGDPQWIEGTWREDATDKNTIVRIVAEPHSNFRDSTLIVYDRLNIAKLAKLLDFKIKAYYPETTHDLIAPVFRRYGIFIPADELVNKPLPEVCLNPKEATIYNRKPTSGSLTKVITNTDIQAFEETSYSDPDAPSWKPPEEPFIDAIYTLEIKEKALGWWGSVVITVGEGDAVIGDYLTQEMLPGMNYPVPGDDGTNGSALVYMYNLDFTPVKDVLETYPEEYIVDEFSDDLLNAIKQVDTGDGKELWNLDSTSTEWSLHGAEIVYNGTNDSSLPTNSRYKYVIGIQLRADITVPPGVMYLHYNDPFDPDLI